jgi:hypothetical protein
MELTAFLTRLDNTPVALTTTAWFQQILCQWGHEHDQKDCAECTLKFLTLLQGAMLGTNLFFGTFATLQLL